MLKIAILDDYTNIALSSADWSILPERSMVTVFDRPLSETEAAVELLPFDVLCTIRERMPLPRTLIKQLPNLKLIVTVGSGIANLDMVAAVEQKIKVVSTKFAPTPSDLLSLSSATPELAWGVMMATVRKIVQQDRNMRAGGWQSALGTVLAGRTLGLLGLGNIGKRMARYAKAFDMNVIAWSQHLTPEAAQEAGAQWVEKAELFRNADIVSVHLVYSERTHRLVGVDELGMMKRQAFIINTSRAAIIDEAALVAALNNHTIAGAGLDVFDREPLLADHPFRSMENITLTPHLGCESAWNKDPI